MPLIRPGVSSATLAANDIHRPPPGVLLSKFGFKWPGFVIPYYDFLGDPIFDKGRPYIRLRLDKPLRWIDEETGKEEEMKYYQHKGSSLHVYVPKGFNANYEDSLVIVEGELKALSLVEAGVPCVAIGGFYSFMTAKKLLPELVDLLLALKPKRLLYLGDGDTSHNALFSSAAVKMADLVAPISVVLPRIPIDMAKGIDDIREELGSSFSAFWNKIVKDAVPLSPGTCPKRLCLVLLEREISKIARFSPTKRAELYSRIHKIGIYKKSTLKARYQGLIARAGFRLKSI